MAWLTAFSQKVKIKKLLFVLRKTGLFTLYRNICQVLLFSSPHYHRCKFRKYKFNIYNEKMDQEFGDIAYSSFMKHNGGLQFREISQIDYEFKTIIKEFHLNSAGITHGGFIASLLDSGMGTAAHRVLGSNIKAATISLDIKFISASRPGDLIIGSAKVLKKTKSLVFMRGEVRCGKRLISTAEGIWKVLKPT